MSGAISNVDKQVLNNPQCGEYQVNQLCIFLQFGWGLFLSGSVGMFMNKMHNFPGSMTCTHSVHSKFPSYYYFLETESPDSRNIWSCSNKHNLLLAEMSAVKHLLGVMRGGLVSVTSPLLSQKAKEWQLPRLSQGLESWLRVKAPGFEPQYHGKSNM